MLDERVLAGPVTLVLPVQLRDRLVGLVEHDEVVVGEVVEEGVWRLAGAATVEVAGVVLDARAHADLAQHLEVVRRAHPEPLRLEELAVLLEVGELLGELDLDLADRGAHPLLGRHVVRRREQHEPLELLDELAGERIDGRDALDLVAEQLDPHRAFLVGGEHLDRVAPHPEPVAREREVVALVPHLDEAGEDRALVALLPTVEDEALAGVLLGSAQAVDRGHRRHDDDVAARHAARWWPSAGAGRSRR